VWRPSLSFQELLERESKAKEVGKYSNIDVNDLLDDPELEALHEQRLAEIKAERERRQQMSHKGHGELTDISEGEFLDVVMKTRLVACHFCHKDFERCKIMDKHLRQLATQYFTTRICKIHAPDAPFFVAKLKVQMLPCVIFFVNGVAIDRVVGFDELGGVDDFRTAALEARMKASGVLEDNEVKSSDQVAEAEQIRQTVRSGIKNRTLALGSSDEDSDF
jgi:thioredoxin-like negative regulator of GroEL